MSSPAFEGLGTFYLGRVVDAATGQDTAELVTYDSRDLTTHAVCVGMTGSGKTGLCLALLEEAALDGVPALVIDPKGDLANLLLAFPELQPRDFEPWVDPGAAARKNQSVSAYAEATAETWRKGLADWQQDGERIRRFRDAAKIALYTPGSHAGRPLALLSSFAPPDATTLQDSGLLKERIGATVSGLLRLVDIDADPLKSREHILLANILEQAWRQGTALDLAGLIAQIQKPPFERLGVFDLETFYPAKDRLELAMAINGLLAAPGFDAWLDGEPVDVQRLLHSESGEPRIAIVSIAHLNDAERMFAVTSLLNEVVAWMRKQGGTSSLRALVYMDEIFGYMPPSAMPPSKLPLLTLMKQARAFGLGVVLATQNPVDLDYKALSNAGTWFVGRLQTERDQARVIEGLLSASSGGLDRAALERLMTQLGKRVFLVRNVHEDAPFLMRTRWTMSYLRGPMTLDEIRKLSGSESSASREVRTAASTAAAPFAQPPSPATTQAAAPEKPMIPPDVAQQYVMGSGRKYVPYFLGTVRAHFIDGSKAIDTWLTRTFLAPMSDDGSAPDWEAAQSADSVKDRLSGTAAPGVGYADVPAALLRAKNYESWSKQLADHAYRSMTCDIISSATLKLSSTPGETESAFRTRIAQRLREKRDAEVDKLRAKYATRTTSLSEQIRRAQERVEHEQSQLSQQKMQTAISVGSALLGALLGRKVASAANIGRAGTAARSAGRISRESEEVERANQGVEALQERLTQLQADLDADVARLHAELDPAAVPIETISIRPRKSGVTTTGVTLLWMPV